MSVGVTALEFLKNDTLGSQYQNDMFAADCNNDYLYDFDLIEDRIRLDLNGNLADKILTITKSLMISYLDKDLVLPPTLRKD